MGSPGREAEEDMPGRGNSAGENTEIFKSLSQNCKWRNGGNMHIPSTSPSLPLFSTYCWGESGQGKSLREVHWNKILAEKSNTLYTLNFRGQEISFVRTFASSQSFQHKNSSRYCYISVSDQSDSQTGMIESAHRYIHTLTPSPGN